MIFSWRHGYKLSVNKLTWIAIRVLITHYLKMFTEINYIVLFRHRFLEMLGCM